MRKYSEYKVYIYTLSDIDDEVRYVGKTNNIKRRYRQHIRESKNGNTYKCFWIRSMDKLPIVKIIHECNVDNCDYWEKHYISIYEKLNFKLTNLTEGGDGISWNKLKDEVKLRMSKNRIGEKNGFYGKHHSEESKLIMSKEKVNIYNGNKNPMYNKHHSKETRLIMSAKKNGKYEGINNPRAKKLYQYSLNNELIKVWNTAKECADIHGMSRGNLSNSAKHNTNKDNNLSYKIVYGYIFKFN
jgi:group I intron endonuclease